MALNIKPLGTRVVVKVQEAETKTKSGIFIPDSAKEKPLRGEVMAVGNGTKGEAMELKVGDVIYSGANADIKVGNTLPLSGIPVGTFINSIELIPGKGAQLVRSAGAMAQLLSKGKTELIKDFVSHKTGRKFEAYLVLATDNGRVSYEFPERK